MYVRTYAHMYVYMYVYMYICVYALTSRTPSKYLGVVGEDDYWRTSFFKITNARSLDLSGKPMQSNEPKSESDPRFP
jgi:hypothetical protein